MAHRVGQFSAKVTGCGYHSKNRHCTFLLLASGQYSKQYIFTCIQVIINDQCLAVNIKCWNTTSCFRIKCNFLRPSGFILTRVSHLLYIQRPKTTTSSPTVQTDEFKGVNKNVYSFRDVNCRCLRVRMIS